MAIAFCIYAGWWQFGAYEDSHGRHADRDREPVLVQELIGPDEPIDAAADRAVRAEGRYMAELQHLVPGRIRDGVLGWYVLTPLRSDDGTVIPVVRGWVMEPETAQEPASTRVAITGHVLPPETPEHATVRSGQVLEPDELAYIAPARVAEATGLPAGETVRGYLLLNSQVPPAGDVEELDVDDVAPIRNVNPWQNFSYGAQWWVFAAAALVFWASAMRASIRSRRRATNEQDASVSEPGLPRVPS
nr:SURF1 family protein [Phytoactinopolyspora alkaliphila]